MTNKEKLFDSFGIEQIQYQNATVQIDNNTSFFGKVYMLKVNGHWYELKQWLNCEEGIVPEKDYIFDGMNNYMHPRE